MFYVKMIYKKIVELKEIYLKSKKINIDSDKKIIYVMLSANYQNLGDIAITLTQIKFLKEKFGKEYEIIEIPVEDTYNVYLDMKKNYNKIHAITLIGGGNNGDLYEFIEKKRRFILKKFKNKKIISFPQSIFFSNNKNSNDYKKLFFKLCEKCDDLTLVARESKSYQVYKENCRKTAVIECPDIVFYNDFDNNYPRKGISLVLRKDKEKALSEDIQEKMINKLKKYNYNITYDDTCDIKLESSRENLFFEYIKKISKKELVITDRLHGMIICYITKTPCLVFDNNNGKIKYTYERWLKNQNFIKLCCDKNVDDIEKIVEKYKNIEIQKDKKIIEKFDILVHLLKGE